ncbi:hypothetical protein M9H77_31319 [Catharanthus roseus]|uniref:Uncharacterized protein n=1 Tax=Catharanthus roseus TaxID=4058 RepID=A0ACB9ZZT2_CATRO|nr:hypothetical protein M9H77_31319 [Catharanthus roseus]
MNGVRRHTRSRERRHSRTGCRGMVAKGPTSTPTSPASPGLSLSVGNACPTALAEGIVSRYMIRPVLGEELKANVERLHIETGSPILTDEQLIFEAFGIFRGIPRGLYQEEEEVVGIHATGTGEVRQFYDIICISVWSAARFDIHSLPSFPAAR